MFRNPFHRDVSVAMVSLIAVLFLCRLTGGVMGILIVLVGVVAAIMHRSGLATTCYLMIPLIQVVNRSIVGMGGPLFLACRFGGPCIIAAMLFSGIVSQRRQGIERLPVGWMWAYLGVACISSITGWMPLVSYFKIAYFAVMLIGLIIISRAIQFDERSIRMLRAVFMALAIIMILGSILVYFIPSVGYSMMIYKAEQWGVYLSGGDIGESEGAVFFNGMTCHSQALAPVVISLAAWVLGDMLYVERKMSLLHVVVLVFVPVLAYMSRSRGALLTIVALLGVTMFYALPRARIPQSVKRHMKMIVALGALLLFAAAVYSELRSNAMSRWMRKVDDVEHDSRTLAEAFTSSRQNLIEMNLHDFRLNPIFGKGFQVSIWMSLASKSKDFNWFTASVEKGVTPYVILGETGICGAVVFAIFLIVFYVTCSRRRYFSLMTCFTCFLVANLADSTLFSPSYLGGFMWVLSCVGCFSTDILARRKDAQQQMFGWRLAPV